MRKRQPLRQTASQEGEGGSRIIKNLFLWGYIAPLPWEALSSPRFLDLALEITCFSFSLTLDDLLLDLPLFPSLNVYFPWFQRMFLTFGGLGFLLGRCPSWCPVRLVMSRATHGVVSGRAICYNEILEKQPPPATPTLGLRQPTGPLKGHHGQALASQNSKVVPDRVFT